MKHIQACDRFDTTDARSDRGFGYNFEQADVAGVLHVRTAAKLGGEIAGADHADNVAVFLAEQRHRAEFFRFVNRHFFGLNRHGRQNRFVDFAFDGFKLVRRQRREVGEVETHVRGVDKLTCLFNMGAERIAQRRLQQVRRGVVAHGASAHIFVNLRRDRFADR